MMAPPLPSNTTQQTQTPLRVLHYTHLLDTGTFWALLRMKPETGSRLVADGVAATAVGDLAIASEVGNATAVPALDT